jgi:hypothetical protein
MIDEDVQDFVNGNVDRNWQRVEEPYVANGGNVPASAYGYSEPLATPAATDSSTPSSNTTAPASSNSETTSLFQL